MNKELVVYIDGAYYPKSQAKVSVYDHGLLYGDGAFLERVNFDDKSAALIKKNIGDEQRHVDNWTRILGELNKG